MCDACWAGVDSHQPAGEYAGPLRDIIHAFKYEGRRSLARPLALRMRARGAAALEGADAVVPVPLHPFRRVRRGFNQAADLSRHLRLPVVHALWRVRYTTSQMGLPAVERRQNVRPGAFRLSPLVRPGALDDRILVLVDDVKTTGATLAACASVLTRAGAREVRTLTAAWA